MAFDGLASKLQDTLKKLKGKGKLTEKDIKEAYENINSQFEKEISALTASKEVE